MFCPDCGTDNSRGQKFCTRCGSNLMAMERARDIVSDLSGGSGSPVEGSTVLKVVALISIFGFLFVTLGGIFLAVIEKPGDSPVPFFTIIGGYTAIVLICRHLLRLISPATQKSENRRTVMPPATASPAVAPGSTNRALGEGAMPWRSVTEESTRQFEGRPQDKA
ncbi:MAG TPA: zinc ribbon domain-containing protein [Blastocatellia bacterium]|nr:zinc ribbon domain-containing protein [Blastocatellia bacterium]